MLCTIIFNTRWSSIDLYVGFWLGYCESSENATCGIGLFYCQSLLKDNHSMELKNCFMVALMFDWKHGLISILACSFHLQDSSTGLWHEHNSNKNFTIEENANERYHAQLFRPRAICHPVIIHLSDEDLTEIDTTLGPTDRRPQFSR
jgi:hypothetical protein